MHPVRPSFYYWESGNVVIQDVSVFGMSINIVTIE